MYDVITIGGATLDIFLDVHEADNRFKIVEEAGKQWLCVPYGGKIAVDGLHFDVGGNGANVAVGLSRLGLATAANIHYGSDEISQKIINTLTKEGVSVAYAVKDELATSPIGVVINFKNERTIFAYHIKRDHRLPPMSAPTWIYLTSVGNYWEELYRQVAAFVIKHTINLAFNPGTYQIQSGGVTSFLVDLQAATVLFVNKEEAGKIAYGISHMANSGENDVKELLTQLQSIGPKIVSITDGSNGSYAIDEEGRMYQLGIFPATVVERTGAGDGYASGFLAALVHGLAVNEAMRFGAVNAASVISTVGAEKGLLKKEEMEKKLSENPEFQATNL